MANYSVDIEVALQGANKLKQFSSEVDKTLKAVNQLNAALEKVKAVNPYDAAGARQVTELDKQRLRIAQERLRAERDFLQATERENQLARQKSAEYLRQLRLQKELIKGAQASAIELGPGGPAFSGGYSPMGRRMANFAAAPPSFINKQVAGRLGGAASNALIGGAFPLLFGQGAGAAAGGAIGGGLGGLLGGQFGFALSLVGTLIGDIASKGQKIKELGEDIGFSSEQTQQLANAFKIANTDAEKFTAVIQNVRGVGLEVEDQAKAIQLITTLTDKYGGSFEKVGNTITSVLESGKVSQANLNQLSSQGIDIQGALAAKYKTSRDNILKMAKDGTISVQTLMDTLVEMGNKGTAAANKPRSAMDNLRDSINKLGAAIASVSSQLVTSLGPVFKWLTDRVNEFINAVSRAVSRLADLIAGGRMTQATIQAETAAQQATTKKFGLLGGIRAINPAAEAFFQQEKIRQLKTITPGAFATPKAQALETFRAPSQAAPTGGGAGTSAKNTTQKIVDITQQELDLRLKLGIAEAQQNREQEAYYTRQLALLEIGQKKIGANQREAEIFAVMVQYNQTMKQIQQDEAENRLPRIIEKLSELSESYSKNLNLVTELTEQQKQQKEVADGIANSVGVGMTSAFDALVQGTQDFGASLQQIASGVLIDIANQLLKIYVINQAINAISGLLGPKTGGFLSNVKFNPVAFSGINLRANGGPVSAGSPYIVGERGPELFMPRSSGSIYPNDAMGMGGANIVVNVDASGSSAQGDNAQANKLGEAIGVAVRQELIKQKRPGGLLS